uniref:Uncharacterized protein n=1 Tax=Lepeophtheirus salmonis TaxID=72036 RepID=A0A0K2T581_LEPSM
MQIEGKAYSDHY